jgi:hypothetical protein
MFHLTMSARNFLTHALDAWHPGSVMRGAELDRSKNRSDQGVIAP